MNKLPNEKRAQVLMALVEGNSIAATCRMTGVAKMTVLSLIREVGSACERFHDAQVRHLPTTQVQCDEVWSFCYSKAKNVPEKFRGTVGYGNVWTWTALDAESKLMISWVVSERTQDAADGLIRDVRDRTMMRVQITSDGFSAYIDAIAKALPMYGSVDYAEEIKVYQTTAQPGMSPDSAASRYSPGRVKSVRHVPRIGMPLDKHISTAYMERWNLTLRMQNRRFTRLTKAFPRSSRITNGCLRSRWSTTTSAASIAPSRARLLRWQRASPATCGLRVTCSRWKCGLTRNPSPKPLQAVIPQSPPLLFA
jgi:IS1 family transposase